MVKNPPRMVGIWIGRMACVLAPVCAANATPIIDPADTDTATTTASTAVSVTPAARSAAAVSAAGVGASTTATAATATTAATVAESAPSPSAPPSLPTGPDKPSLGIDVGTTGAGVQAELLLSRRYRLAGRFGINRLPHYAFSRSTQQVNYDFRASLRTVDVLLDWHPAENGFRLSAGVIYNDNRVDGIGLPNRVATFTVGNASYSTTQAGRLDGRIDFANLAPYLGIGWQSWQPAPHGWHLSSDLGVMYQGSPTTRLGISGCSLPAALCATVNTALAPTVAAEAQRLDQQLKNYRFFPVLRIGLNYQF